MERNIGTHELKHAIAALDNAAQKAGIKGLRVILCGGLAAIAYGIKNRVTLDIEAFTTHNINVFLLSPLDLIISKLRVFRDKDIQDALFLVKKFHITKTGILKASKQAVMQSPASTEIMRFKKNIKYFLILMD